jgi:hypothetical protein
MISQAAVLRFQNNTPPIWDCVVLRTLLNHDFCFSALAAQHDAGRNISVASFFDTWGRRVTLYLRFLEQLEMIVLRIPPLYCLWIGIRCGSNFLANCGCGNGGFASSTNIREGILVCRCSIHFHGHRVNRAFPDHLLQQDASSKKS